LETFFFQKYRLSLSADEITNYLQKIAGTQNFNYYSDLRLINAGGDRMAFLISILSIIMSLGESIFPIY